MTYVLEHKPHPLALIWRRDGTTGTSYAALRAIGDDKLRRDLWLAWRVVHSRTGETVAECN